jgi:hypothetical protein
MQVRSRMKDASHHDPCWAGLGSELHAKVRSLGPNTSKAVNLKSAREVTELYCARGDGGGHC